MKTKSIDLKLNLDLAKFPPGSRESLALALGADGAVQIKSLPGDKVSLYVSTFIRGIRAPEGTCTITDIIALSIEFIHQHVRDLPDEFPPKHFPNGASDWILTRFCRSAEGHGWFLGGTQKPVAVECIPRVSTPERSIDLRRQTATEKQLISSEPFPTLEKLTIRATQSPYGKHSVIAVYDREEDCPTPRKTAGGENAELRLSFTAASLPSLDWPHDIFLRRSPATQTLHIWNLQWAKKPVDWLRRHSVEAVFVKTCTAVTKPDLRASLVSGAYGPAPFNEGRTWPCCPGCEEPLLFSQSLDMRDMGFADLLPGTTAVIFVCNGCLDNGEWANCSEVLWLDASQPVTLLESGKTSPLVQQAQYYGYDLIDRNEMQQDVCAEMEHLDAIAKAPGLWFPASYGTKAGGVPFYLQADPVLYDRTGKIMEYIGQIGTPEHISFHGFGYIFHSTSTGETYVEFQDT